MPWLIVHILCPLFVLVDDYHHRDDDDDCVQVIQWLVGNMVVASSGPRASQQCSPEGEHGTQCDAIIALDRGSWWSFGCWLLVIRVAKGYILNVLRTRQSPVVVVVVLRSFAEGVTNKNH